MAMQKLSCDIQSLFCASTQIWSYKRAVEELVYNSLDAESTSIAIRINIEQNSIQVIDNGCGVSKRNFTLVGHRHATSKCVDVSTLKSVPNTYGYRGQSLASIIEVSENVKITSRCQDTEDMWEKSFCKGKEQNLSHTSKRPSKGTTVDIAGFLYNQKIQKNAIDSLTELNDIKNFLEQLSLVHSNISVSLRDDTKNSIIFKLHKNRDIYQTLTSLYGIERKDVQELKVEKNLYKVTGYIGKKDKDNDKEICQNHWVYLNGRVLRNSKVQKIVNDNLTRLLKLNLQNTRKIKSKIPHNQEEGNLSKKGIPFYFIFITCPYNDYDIIYASKQTELEFKNWEHINKLIEKMAKFYAGDNLKDLKPVRNQVENKQKTENTRDQVKKIMDKILGSNPKKNGVSQMQNGIKGKITKRKPKKKVNKVLPAESKNKTNKKETVNPTKINTTNNKKTLQYKDLPINKYSGDIEMCETQPKKTKMLVKSSKVPVNIKSKSKVMNKNKQTTRKVYEEIQDNMKDKIAYQDKPIINRRKFHENKKRKTLKLTTVNDKKQKLKLDHTRKVKKPTASTKNPYNAKKITKNVRKDLHQNLNDPLMKIFKDPSGSVKKRCDILAKKVDNLMSYKKQRKRKIFINETVQYSNIVRDNKNYSVRKKIGEIVIHDYIPKPTGLSSCTFDDRVWDNKIKKDHKSSYDLVQTILRTQETRNSYIAEVDVANDVNDIPPEPSINDISAEFRDMISKPSYSNNNDTTTTIPLLPRLTFESHNYVENWNRISHNYNNENNECGDPNKKSANTRFITTQSRDNFVIPAIRLNPRKKFSSKIKHVEFQSNKINLFIKNVDNHEETPFTIDFSKSHENQVLDDNDVNPNRILSIELNENELETHNEDETYTINQNNDMEKEVYSQNDYTYTINHHSTIENKRDEEGTYFEDVEHVDYIEDSTERLPFRQDNWKSDSIENENFNHTVRTRDEYNMNVVFISKSQEQQASNNFDPLYICETMLSQDLEEHETNCREWNDSLFNGELNVDSFLCNRNAYTQSNLYEPFNEANLYLNTENRHDLERENFNRIEVIKEKDRLDMAREVPKDVHYKCDQTVNNVLRNNMNDQPGNKDENDVKNSNNFHFKNRLRFVPKGMSQIFTKYQTRNVCDYNLEKEYYEEEIYNNFANDVQLNCEIFEPGVQNVKELTTKAIEKVSNKFNKDNASLIFNGEALKKATCLRQIDNKFIAAKIEGKPNQSMKTNEYLVLFDQHAVDERIRLENNLSDYFNGSQWKSMPLDNITLKLTKDEILFLHNYKDKFNQFGLQWVILTNGEVSINAIPEAILGKNPRQVEIVMKAVKNLIVEEINAIKAQSGCISLYPKSIMDLVFSEACRYAVKFGDSLSKEECEELLNSLSECKVPFQCAHGRPVMAVLMDIKKDFKKYQVDGKSLLEWIKVKKHVKKK